MGGEDEGNTIISFTDLTQILSTAPVLSFTEGGGTSPVSTFRGQIMVRVPTAKSNQVTTSRSNHCPCKSMFAYLPLTSASPLLYWEANSNLLFIYL